MIGFGLPCPDELDSKKDEEKVSMLVYYLDKTIKSWKDGSNTSDKNSTDGNGGMRTKRLEQFRKEIQDKTKKLVEDYEKQQKQELNKEEQEQKKEEGK
jgi:glutamate synthase domain-containing protein 1